MLTAMQARRAAIEMLFGIWAKVHVRSAAQRCHRLYFTTRRPPLLPRDERVLSEGTPLRIGWSTPPRAPHSCAGSLAGWQWGSGPVVLLIHGWHSRAGHMAGPYVEALVHARFRVVAFDMPGHGASAGNQSDLFSWCSAVRCIVQRVGEPAAIVAHSFGAPVAVQALRESGWSSRFVAVAPLVRLKDAPARFCETLGLSGALRDEFSRLLLATHPEQEWHELSLLGSLPADVAALFVQDEDDRETPWAGAADAARHWNASFALTHGLGHRRILRDPVVVRTVRDFIVRAA